jgi:proline iminopeptidase
MLFVFTDFSRPIRKIVKMANNKISSVTEVKHGKNKIIDIHNAYLLLPVWYQWRGQSKIVASFGTIQNRLSPSLTTSQNLLPVGRESGRKARDGDPWRAGQSKPYAEIKENTIQHLVEDIEKLRTHLGLGKVLLFGGSWGSTLALAYAETYPQNVSGMVLRGVFTATKAEIDHFYHGATARYFPENYEKLLQHIDKPEQKNYPAQLLEKIRSSDPATRKKYALAWAMYEIKMAVLQISDKMVDDFFKEWNPYDFALLENYYMANNCFLEEGQLLNNADKLKDIPVTIVNGRYDVICPPITAYKLHKKLLLSKLIIVERAGHSANAEPLRTFLVNAVKAFE